MITKEMITNDIKQVSQKVDKVPTCKEYQQYGTYDLGTVYHLFESWNNAKSESLGISVQPYRIPKKEIILDLLTVGSKLDRVPSKNEYHQYGQYTYPAIVAKFGSWNKALQLVFGSTHEEFTLLKP